MSFIDKFRELLGLNVRHIDQQMSGDAEAATRILKDRADMHLDKIGDDLGRHLDARIAEHKAQFEGVEPVTFDTLLPAPPATALLSPVKTPAGDAKPEDEKPAPAPPVAPVEASPVAALPPVPAANDASPETPEKQSEQEELPAAAVVAEKPKKPRAKRSRY